MSRPEKKGTDIDVTYTVVEWVAHISGRQNMIQCMSSRTARTALDQTNDEFKKIIQGMKSVSGY